MSAQDRVDMNSGSWYWDAINSGSWNWGCCRLVAGGGGEERRRGAREVSAPTTGERGNGGYLAGGWPRSNGVGGRGTKEQTTTAYLI